MKYKKHEYFSGSFKKSKSIEILPDFLTVVLLTYNRSLYATQALNAILTQSYKFFKIIIIDNHSSDDTYTKLSNLIGDDNRVTYVRLNKESNAANSYIAGIRMAESEFILVTHDDDILDLDYVENIIKICSKYPDLGLVAANARLINSDGLTTNSQLYELKSDILFKKGEYLDHYFKTKMWLPTPSVCFRKIHFLNFFGDLVYPLYTKSIKNKLRSQDLYKPSSDILFSFVINNIQKIFFLSRPFFSYRQHEGQESRNVNQGTPMRDLMNDIQSAGIKIRNRHSFININIKYDVQNFLLNNLVDDLQKYLLYSEPCLHSSIASNLFLGKNCPLKSELMFKDDIFFNFYKLLYINDPKPYLLFFKQKRVVLIGSMLVAYYLEAFLRINQIIIDSVLDMAPARQGGLVGSSKVLSYENFFNNENNIDSCIFLITSERDRDVSIVEMIKGFGHSSNCIFWQDIFIPQN
jgi:glycosyltransferase involved in cell wall biosynthesis